MRQLAATSICVILLAAGAGCQSLPEAQPTTQAKRVHPRGTYRHAFTQLALPEESEGFERLYVTEYDPAAADISGHYRGTGTIPITATVYHYPATEAAVPPTRDEFVGHFEQVLSHVSQANPGAELLGKGGVTATINGMELHGAHARFRLPSFPGYLGGAESHLYLFALDGWYLKFRFTHPDAIADDSEPREQAFMEAVTWPRPD